MAKARILIVEDEALVASDIEESLESVGYRIVGAVPSAEEGLVKVREQQPDLVLMDIKLGGEMDYSQFFLPESLLLTLSGAGN